MPFWVHGRDSATGRPRDSMFIEVESEVDARQQATEAGMTVDEVEFVQPTPIEDTPVATNPTPAPRCVRCNSDRVVPRATIWDRDTSTGMSGHPLQAYVNTRPDAIIFRAPVYVTLYARVCADCGHAELFAEGAEALYAAYQKSRAEDAQ